VVTGCKLNIRHCFSFRRKGLTQRVIRMPDGTEVTTFRSGDEGRFRIELRPGVYLIEQLGSSGGVGRMRPFRVTVETSRFTYVKLHYVTLRD
jgi:hypothetical protein